MAADPATVIASPQQRVMRWLVRVLSFGGGAYIMHHEVVVADTSEPLLVLVALYLLGVPIADIVDQIRRITGGDSK